MSKPDCYKCEFRIDLRGNCHSGCINVGATVEGNQHGIKNGWFYWPMNFDPVWLMSCSGFQPKPTEETSNG